MSRRKKVKVVKALFLKCLSNMKEINMSIKSVKVEATTRHVRAQWTAQMASDIASLTSIDFEAELRAILRQQNRTEKLSKILNSVKHYNSF